MNSELDLEARNAEHKVGELILDDLAVYFFAGDLDLDEEENWVVNAGDGYAVEFFDRCKSSVWTWLNEAEARAIAAAFEEMAAKIASAGVER